METIEIRQLTQNDEHILLKLLNTVFTWGTIEKLQWKFFNSPYKTQFFLGLINNQVHAAYGGIILKTYYKGTIDYCIQVGDSASNPTSRGLNVFLKTSKANLKFLKENKMFAYAYGFPAMRPKELSNKSLGTKTLEQTHALSKLLILSNKSTCACSFLEKIPSDINECWIEHKDSFPLMLCKDYEYLKWRYEDCPYDKYKFLKIPYEKTKYAFFVLKDLSLQINNDFVKEAIIMDLLLPNNNAPLISKIFLELENFLKINNYFRIKIRIPPNSQIYNELRKSDYSMIIDRQFCIYDTVKETPYKELFESKTFFYTYGDWDVF